LNLNTGVVIIAAKFRQQHRLAQKDATPRAWKLKEPPTVKHALAARRKKQAQLSMNRIGQRLPIEHYSIVFVSL